ncbi:MAG: hypothetical protein R8G34_07650 [Paracoccaceae bacterium]|nr:hypothetical protein [Paracoccaceae bacterium]
MKNLFAVLPAFWALPVGAHHAPEASIMPVEAMHPYALVGILIAVFLGYLGRRFAKF